jgi:DNA-binding winged helix-turn-helix (wHTH) protein/TolB-like protein/Flp pilus assembly protein TadD
VTSRSPGSYRFDGFRVDTVSRELIGADGRPVALTGKAYDVLLCLVEQAPSLVRKDALLEQVWAGRVVDENNLTQAISSLRKAFGTGAGDHRYILTEARRGYRFVAEVQCDEPPLAAVAPVPAAARTLPVPGRLRARLSVVLLLVLLLGWLAVSERRALPPVDAVADTGAASVAILPFRGVGDAPRDELLELGLADTLIAQLGRSGRLSVRSLASSQRVARATADAQDAGRRLGADYVVEGSIQNQADWLRVNARLIETRSSRILWVGTFDAPSNEVFTLQDRIAAGVASALAVQIDLQAGVPRSPCDGADPEAYRAYLTGRHLIGRPDATSLPRALAAFQQAIELDPTCARAYAGLAFVYRALTISGDRAPRETMPLSRAAAEQALRLDPGLAEAHATRAFLLFWYDWDWAGAEAGFKRAIELNPSLSDAHFGYGNLLVHLGRFDEGLLHARRARERDLLSPLVNAIEAGMLTAAGEYELADAALRHSLELQPGFWIALLIRGGIALDRGDPEAALADLQQAVEQSRGNSGALALLGMAQAAAGDHAGAEATLSTLYARGDAGYLPPTSVAAVHLALGDHDRAMEALEHAYALRDVRLAFLKVDARWNPLREDPRFRALSERLDLYAAQASGRF